MPGTRPPEVKETPPRTAARGGSDAFCKLAAKLGYHAIVLTYPNTISASVCRKEADPGAFEEFYMALIASVTTKHITVSRVDSIENRLIKLLQHLVAKRAREEWSQFLNADGSIKWERLAVAGQSQSG